MDAKLHQALDAINAPAQLRQDCERAVLEFSQALKGLPKEEKARRLETFRAACIADGVPSYSFPKNWPQVSQA